MLNVAVLGFGYWGPNLVRNFNGIEGVRTKYICDLDPEACKSAAKRFPNIDVSNDFNSVLKKTDVDIVAIATPVGSHFELARAALENHKHIFVEKPFTANSDQAQILIDLAAKKNLKIMVDHTFIFTGAVSKMKSMIDNGDLGKLYYFDSTRVNLGLFQHDVNVIWDLAPHDFSILDYIVKKKPHSVVATGFDHYNRGLVNLAYCCVYYDDMIAHFNVNWLSPVKIRKTLVGGSQKMLVWDDLASDDKLRVYDKGAINTTTEGIHKLKWDYRSGDIFIPHLDQTEPLKAAVEHFIATINNQTECLCSGEAGLRIVRLLAACNESLEHRGREVIL